MDRTWMVGAARTAVGGPLDSLPRPVIPRPARTSMEMHAHVRRLILEGFLSPGTELTQAGLARAFGVSRTPLREAFRILREVGRIAADINHRRQQPPRTDDVAERGLHGLGCEAHRDFHRLLVVRCTPTVLITLASCAERALQPVLKGRGRAGGRDPSP
ncbi:GntR family transcriptional regulator [Streptomyces sp. NBC_01373]|uniref:GntR family transcriptional regulator n=1 Tax=Streptomyces sp. NBC_01373 TaxID=2903843 RepID=UPI00224E7333|nr:GntR family transcriptional regulator [Streptomyces sp. NBC_01373]MCX4706472.1 GntR family transcriptional regulator [Streptomyces sp. NBC_01373]